MIQFKYLLIPLLIYSVFTTSSSQKVEIKKIHTNSLLKNDFAPYVIDSVLYFSTNRKHEIVKSYLNNNNEWVYRLYQANILPDDLIGKEKEVSNSQLSKLNTPTIACNEDNQIIVITQNQYNTIKKSRGRENLLGIFFIKNEGGKWGRPTPFKFNSKRNYSNVHPTISPDGKTIYFVSDMPGGIGKADLYESDFKDGDWSEPVNLGAIINTEGNEVFPFYHPSGKLYFSSEGHDSTGKLDIFYTSKSGGEWTKPIKLEDPINSTSNDFSCYIFPSQTEGFFASDRSGNADIYRFSTPFPTFPNAKPQVEDIFCFTLFENGPFVSDTLPYKYKWYFGDGNSATGQEVDYCYSKPGEYNIQLNVVDTLINQDLYTVANYNIKLELTQQIYISSPDTIQLGTTIEFSTTKSVLKDFIPSQFYWDFGDSNKGKGETITHIFRKKGIYTITCGAISKSDLNSKLSSTKKIVVID